MFQVFTRDVQSLRFFFQFFSLVFVRLSPSASESSPFFRHGTPKTMLKVYRIRRSFSNLFLAILVSQTPRLSPTMNSPVVALTPTYMPSSPPSIRRLFHKIASANIIPCTFSHLPSMRTCAVFPTWPTPNRVNKELVWTAIHGWMECAMPSFTHIFEERAQSHRSFSKFLLTVFREPNATLVSHDDFSGGRLYAHVHAVLPLPGTLTRQYAGARNPIWDTCTRPLSVPHEACCSHGPIGRSSHLKLWRVSQKRRVGARLPFQQSSTSLVQSQFGKVRVQFE